MKHFTVIVITVLALSSARAQQHGFGVGAILGEPIGGSFKMWLSDQTAVDAAVAYANWSDGALSIHGDYLWHNFDWLSAGAGKLPVYFGLGGRVKFTDDTRFGIRAPIGVSYMLDNVPVDVFGEVAPILDVTPGIRVEWSFAVGARYWF
jgi:hypothetical protein